MINAVVTDEIKLFWNNFWNNFSVYFTCSHVWNYFKIIFWGLLQLMNIFQHVQCRWKYFHIIS